MTAAIPVAAGVKALSWLAATEGCGAACRLCNCRTGTINVCEGFSSVQQLLLAGTTAPKLASDNISALLLGTNSI
jgi:hypothetical protein